MHGDIVKKVETLSPEAAAILRSLPEQVAESLMAHVQSPKLLVVGLLAAVRKTPTPVLARTFRIPESWVLKNRDLCFRALRANSGTTTRPPPG